MKLIGNRQVPCVQKHSMSISRIVDLFSESKEVDMGCVGYRDQPCECEDKGLIEEDGFGILLYLPNDGSSGLKTPICSRCSCVTEKNNLRACYHRQTTSP